MKRLIFTILILGFYSNVKSQESIEERFIGFRWTLDGIHVLRIDTEKLTLSSEDLDSKISVVGQLKTSPNIFKDLPPLFNTNTTFNHGKIIFTVKGTGQVYELNPKTLDFKREDITYFRGFNFSAHQFYRNDTLFSVGGAGFWLKHSLITYFDKEAKEWNLFKKINEQPAYVDDFFSGYEKGKDVFFALEYLDEDFIKNRNIAFYEFGFKNKIWTKKGNLNSPIVEFLKEKSKYIWTGKYAIFHGYHLLIIDPIQNKAYHIKSWNRLSSDYSSIVSTPIQSIGKKIYIRKLNTETTGSKFTVDSFSVDDLIKKATFIWEVYEEDSYSSIYIKSSAGVGGLIIFLFIITFVIKKKQKNIVKFDELELDILYAFTLLKKDQSLSVNELNSLLDFEDKTYDNQRKIRQNTIFKLNDKLERKFKLKDAIQKIASAEDKRVSNYFLNEKIKSKIVRKRFD
jgi:hypothetical protein